MLEHAIDRLVSSAPVDAFAGFESGERAQLELYDEVCRRLELGRVVRTVSPSASVTGGRPRHDVAADGSSTATSTAGMFHPKADRRARVRLWSREVYEFTLLKAVWGIIEVFFALDGVVRWVLADPQLAPPVIAPECLTRAHRFARTRRAFTTR